MSISIRKKIPAFLSAALILLAAGCTDIPEKASVPVSGTVPADTSAGTSSSVISTEAEIQGMIDIEDDDDEPEEVIPPTVSATVVCAGDNLIHTPIYRNAKIFGGGENYDFMPFYKNMGTLISEADLAILNQETIISDDFEPDTYPSFCTPSEMARDMTALGFDAFSISNNHVLDKGEEGLISTLNFWRENYPQCPVYGAYLNDDDMNDIRTLDVNGIKFAFLGYTEHTNGRSLPPGSLCRIVYVEDEDIIEQQVKRAAEISDCVIVSVHFGIEVSNTVTDEQRAFSKKLADWGADLIVGTQPHTIQTMQYIDAADGRKAFVFYCLGNFISAMDNPISMAELLGRITVTKDNATGKVTLSGANALPLVNHFTKAYDDIAMYPLDKYTRTLASTHAISGATYDLMIKLFRENIPEEFIADGYRDLVFGE